MHAVREGLERHSFRQQMLTQLTQHTISYNYTVTLLKIIGSYLHKYNTEAMDTACVTTDRGRKDLD